MIPCQDPAIGFCSNLIPPSGGTYTLTQFLGVFLARAEELAGPRDPSFTILGIEFFGWEKDKAQPETWFPGGRNHIAIRLTRDVANNPQRAIFQLSHEVAHLITPLKKPEVANNLEEGFASVLADYRRYVMPVPFYTIAARVMHYGRYGGASDDARLFPLFIGYPNLVRGYDVNTFDAADCRPTATSDCPAFDRLVGSRLLVGNLELRFPLLRPFGASQRMYGPVPVEVAFFADGGVAWNRNEKPSFLGGSRQGVGSAGVTLRVNLFGFAVGSFDFARPFQRVGKGWVFQFNLSPGF